MLGVKAANGLLLVGVTVVSIGPSVTHSVLFAQPSICADTVNQRRSDDSMLCRLEESYKGRWLEKGKDPLSDQG